MYLLFVISLITFICFAHTMLLKLFLVVVVIYLCILVYQKSYLKQFIIFVVCVLLYGAYLHFYLQYYQVDESYHVKERIVLVINKKTTEATNQYIVKEKNWFVEKFYILIQDKQIDDLQLGTYISVTGKAEPVVSTNNRYLFNYEQYTKSMKQFHQIYKPSIEIIHKYSYEQNVLFFKELINKYIQDNFSGSLQNYLYAFILGDASALGDEYQQLLELGIAHLILLRGSYLTKGSQIIKRVLQRFSIPDETVKVMVIIFTYSLSIFFWKHLVVKKMVIKQTGELFFEFFKKDKTEKIERLVMQAGVSIILLLSNPFLIFNTGFIYLTIISIFFSVYQKNIYYLSDKWYKFLISILATAVILPIMLYEQQSIQLFYIIYLLIFPFIGKILFCVCLFTLIVPYVNSHFIHLFDFVSKQLVWITNTAITIEVPWMFRFNNLLYYICFFSLLDFWKEHSLLKKVNHLYLVGVLILSTLYVNYSFQSIHFLSLPYGETTIIKTSEAVYMIDTGGHHEARQNQYQVDNILLPFLKKLHIHKIDHLILTHDDSDHLGAASYFSAQVEVANIYINRGTDAKQFTLGNVQVIDNYLQLAHLQIFSLFPTNDVSDNNLSLVSYGAFGGKSWLFMGDIEKEGEVQFLKRYSHIEIDVLKLGHHGSKTSSTESFLKQLAPKTAIITVQQKNIHNHPHQEVIDRLNEQDIKYFLTNDYGSIHYFFIGNFSFFTIE